ncbi:MAG: ribosome recycling factor [Puniceicoccaceae bacterium]|nr:MAG: ribosome recycling factor [Puniceicoccaceae bacterium]
MTPHPIIQAAEAKMDKAFQHTLHEFSSIHTGKATPTMVEGIMVEAYDGQMRLKELAAITTPDSRLIQIQPWDKSLIKPIEKALQMANIGINPAVDGTVIRMPLPDMSRERREELAKVAHRLAEEGRVGIRHARREALEAIKKLQKSSELSEDEAKRLEKEVQQLTDKFIADIATHLEHKEKDLTTV